jgi:hypothetical protein
LFFNILPQGFECVSIQPAGHKDGLSETDEDLGEGFGHHETVPAVEDPAPLGRGDDRQDGCAGELGNGAPNSAFQIFSDDRLCSFFILFKKRRTTHADVGPR